MKYVFHPPSKSDNWIGIVLGGLAISICVFLVLPLTQLVSGRVLKQYNVTAVEASMPPPPPPPSVEEQPPPEEPPDEPPPPELSELPQQLNLSDLDLDVNVGTGGAFGSGMNLFQDAAESLEDSNIFDISDLDQAPRRVAAIAPRVAGLPKESGVVVAVFIVDEQGRVIDPRIESSHHPDFEKPVLEALKRWKFSPGSKAGDSVRTYVRQSFPFKFR